MWLTETSEHRKGDDDAGGDQREVPGAHVESVPQELVQERAVVHHPDAQREEHHGADLTSNTQMKNERYKWDLEG